MIKIVVVPSDMAKPAFVQEIEGTLQEMQAIVGGCIEMVICTRKRSIIMWCNEEDKLVKLPLNRRATALWHRYSEFNLDDLRGDVFITGPADSDGATTSVSDEIVQAIDKLNTTK